MTDEERKEMHDFFARKASEYETPESAMGIGKKLDDIVYQLKVLNETLRRKNNG